MNAAREEKASMGELPECLQCGVCCHDENLRYIRLFGSDIDRMGDALDAYTYVDEGLRYMKMRRGRCIALELTSAHAACSIYELRPSVCRELARGSFDCMRQREAKLLECDRLVVLRRDAAGDSDK